MNPLRPGRLRRRPSPSRVWMLWLVSILPLGLLGLHATAILPLNWSEWPIEDFQPVASASYVTSLQTRWMSARLVGESPIQVLEEARPLPCPDAPAAAIAELGGGRFRLDDGKLLLSTTDNTDPRSNGRRYLLRWPTPPPVWVVLLSLVMALIGSGLALLVRRRERGQVFGSPSLVWSLLIVVVALVAHRWWFFADVPLPAVYPDSDSYFEVARTIAVGQWPSFEIRPPGYPILLRAALAGTNSLYGLVLVQTVLTLSSALVLVYAAYRVKPALAPGVALAMAAFVTGVWPLNHDTAIASETLYVNCIILGIGCLILGLVTESRLHFCLASAALGAAILTRPAGLFVLAPFLLTLGFLSWNRRPTSELLSFAIPLPALLLALSTYNYVKVGVFAITAWGEANLAVASFTMWDTRHDYPPEINAHVLEIRTLIQSRLSDEDRATLASSWDPNRLAPVFEKGFYQPALNRASGIGDSYLESRRWIRRISIDAIATHRSTYARFVWTMAYLFYVRNITHRADFSEYLSFRLGNLFPRERPDANRAELLQYFGQSRPVALHSRPGCSADDALTIAPTTARRVHRLVQKARDTAFARTEWVYVFAVVVLAAIIRLAASRGRHLGAFILTATGSSAIAAGLVVCLVEYANFRYSYPTEFVYYVTSALAPIGWIDLRRPRA